MHFRFLIAAFFLIAAPAAPFAQTLACDARFDRNGNGSVEIGSELDLCVLHQTSPLFRKYDRNVNGRLDAGELRAIEEDARNSDEFITLKVDTEDSLGATGGIEARPVVVPRAPGEREAYHVNSGLLLRKAYKAPSVIEAPETDIARVAGATFSYAYDNLMNSYTAIGSGAVMAYAHWDLAPGGFPDLVSTKDLYFAGAALHAGAEFNRLYSSGNPARNIDSLVLRGGGEVNFEGIPFSHYLRAYGFDSTDFHFNSHIVGGAAEWELVNLDLGIGVAKQIGSLPLYYRWRPMAHLEYQYVLDDGGDAKMANQPDLLLAGAILDGTLFFGGYLERLFLDATYWKLFDLTGADYGLEYFEIGANWNIDDAGHFALSATYRTGDLPQTRYEVNDFMVGLTAKF